MAKKTPVSIVAIFGLLLAMYWGIDLAKQNQPATPESPSAPHLATVEQDLEQRDPIQTGATHDGVARIQQAFERKQQKVQVQSSGRVKAILKDDLEGSRHQKFILSITPDFTVLVAHNIDLAPRIEALRVGDIVKFYGEYAYSDQGGVIHWTHHDPQHRHIDGWLKHDGKVFK